MFHLSSIISNLDVHSTKVIVQNKHVRSHLSSSTKHSIAPIIGIAVLELYEAICVLTLKTVFHDSGFQPRTLDMKFIRMQVLIIHGDSCLSW